MKSELQFKLQAHLDGELSDSEAREVASLLAQDADAAALYAELTNTRGALKGFESEIKLPESREFYWSKIQREIEREEQTEQESAPHPVLAMLRRLLVPAMGVAAVLLAVSLIGPQLGGNASAEAEMETMFADAGAMTYRDYQGGTTLIWLPYPAENEFADTERSDILN
jgi:anti-sigma factor RsiW